MDTELYQILSLALLGLIVLVLLAVLSSLGRLRKTLAAGAGAQAAERAPEEERREPEATTMAEEPADLAPATAATAAATTPEPQPEPSLGTAGLGAAGFGAPPEGSQVETQEPAAAEPEPQPAAETPTSAPAWDEEEDKFAAQYQPPVARQPEPEAEPVQPAETGYGLEGAGAGAAAAEPQAAEPAATEEPKEQPFERDGKWFFRRGDELLTYEESTGQWVPAEGPQTGTAAAPSAAPVQEDDTQRFETTPETSEGAEEPVAATSSGGFWKCPSCGAVNGSTATTCRMCFTARP
jgi:hypothetical protein